jgi:hypothetical protein
MAIALEDRLLVLTLFAGAAFLLPVLIAGVVWPRFLAWMAHLTTIVAGFLLIVALVFGALEYRKYRSEQRAHRAALSGLTASDLRRHPQLGNARPRDFIVAAPAISSRDAGDRTMRTF